jgi:hypothetical protein
VTPVLTVNANILDVPAEALLLTIDGAKAGMEGNIARQFARRWPEDWTYMARSLRYPIPLGRTVALPWEGDAPWMLFLFASTLHHLDVLEDGEKAAVVTRAFLEGLKLCIKHGANSLSTPVLQGGWRLSQQQALDAMWGPAARSVVEHSGLKVSVCCMP